MISKNIYSSACIKHMDNNCGIPELVLMKNAAECLYNRLLSTNKLTGCIAIICGKGNNGGDGYALGQILVEKSIDVRIYATEPPKTDAAIHYKNLYLNAGGIISENLDAVLYCANVIVDCIFGFSFSGEVIGAYKDAINKINAANCFVLSADLPSGLEADKETLGKCYVQADITSTFSAKKIATSLYPARSACGVVHVEDIGMPQTMFDEPLFLSDGDEFVKFLPVRSPTSHKGSFGTLSALVGCDIMPGAAFLACLAALQSGVGLVRLFSQEKCLDAVSGRLAEPVLSKLESTYDIVSKKCTARLIGCGCGRYYDNIIKELIFSDDIPTVLDADGINCIADNIQLYQSMRGNLIVTPHEMEMARLIKCDVNYVSSNRLHCAKTFSDKYGVITVLKGAATIVSEPMGRIYINSSGNSGLAKGGSGDVLAGLTASLLAQGVPPFEAAVIAVFVHGKAADILEKKVGQYAMLPSMLPLEIGKILAGR